MIDRKAVLGRLVVGDIFHATSGSGAPLVCLIMSITGMTIHARTMTTQYLLKFDQHTGKGELKGEITTIPCTINSIAPLPVDIHNVMLGIDRKFRLEWKDERIRLNDDEKRALLFLDAHYALNPLPPI